MPSRPGPCPECGFDPTSVSPADAAVAARSYPRRYRALLVRPDDDDPEIVHRRPSPDEPSAVGHVARAAADLGAAGEALQRIRVHDEPEIALDVVLDGPSAGSGSAPPTSEDALAALTAAATSFAARVESLRGDEWRRLGRLAGNDDVTALDVARHGVHAGIHHLRAAERALARAKTATR